jgi:RimJ/RimL family protein N-acetyltransferase
VSNILNLHFVTDLDWPVLHCILANKEVAFGYFGAFDAVKINLHNEISREREIGKDADCLSWVFSDNNRNKPIGYVRIAGGELSYFLDRAFWGRGLARQGVAEACERYTQYRDISSFEAKVLRENIASQKLLQALSFRYAGSDAIDQNNVLKYTRSSRSFGGTC